MVAHEVIWWEIESPDPAGTRRFYAELFGWSFREEFADSELGHPYWIIEHEGKSLGGLQPKQVGSGLPEPGARLYVEVNNLEETLENAVRLGATRERDRIFLGSDDFWFANVRDPQGISLGLWTANPGR